MDTLQISLENCFGIGNLNHSFQFRKSRTALIYAPNGTMKTSFAKTLDLISKNNPKNVPCDRVYKARETKYQILNDGNEILPENILVINAEDHSFDASNKISAFLASQELKNKYDKIYDELNKQKLDFIKKLKSISQSTDCETEFINSFADSNTSSFFEILTNQIQKLKDNLDRVQFRYNDVFDKKGNVKKFLEKNQEILDQYINDYKNIISRSNFFKESSNSTFGTYQANEILKSIEDNSFFDAGHKFLLDDGTEVNNSEQLKQLVQDEIQNILNDEKLKSTFEKVDKAISNNTELRAFQKVIEKNNMILINLKDYEKFRQDVWIDFLSEIKVDTEELVKIYIEKKNELEQIITEARKEIESWKNIIDKFNSRFFVPFKVILSNQEDIILKKEIANLDFEYSDRNESPVRQEKNSLLDVLSKGEQRAYFILQFLFEIESRKSNTETNLLILDDIADSFDYKNKFAIIEYIKELHVLTNFRIIILTHNFDFYRTIASRLNLPGNNVFMAIKNEVKEINLLVGQYRKDVFSHFIGRFSEPKVFISLIAFVRNLIEYSQTEASQEYLSLTSCLHLKTESNDLTVNDILGIFGTKLSSLLNKTVSFGDENIINLIYQTADSICNETSIDEILLENKITLAIAIRLKAEKYLITKLSEFDINTITSNQTQKLYQEYKTLYPNSNCLRVLDKVNLMTPENIHLNAFMYEPLIDMSVQHLINLYKETSNLN